jgi:hypothetical protein
MITARQQHGCMHDQAIPHNFQALKNIEPDNYFHAALIVHRLPWTK